MINNTEQNKQPALIDINIPDINESGYAEALNNAFKNIDINFETLANYNFIKGESGASLAIKETPFYINGKLSYYGELLKQCILSRLDNETERVGDLSLFDNFTEENAGSIYMIYSSENDLNTTPYKPIASLYYTFLDGRFAPKNANIADESAYTELHDLSCIVVYDPNIVDSDGYVSGGFKVLENAFPTMYYEQGVGLCWNINGSKTGLPVRGIPGKNGLNAKIHVVKITDDNTVTYIFEGYDGYVSVDKIDDLPIYDDRSAVVIDNAGKFYFGTLKYENNSLKAYCDPDNSINSTMDDVTFVTSMKHINILSNDNSAKGLFIPLQDPDDKQKVHLLSAASIANLNGKSNDLKTDVLFTTVNDINSFNLNDNGKCQIDKYLYLELNNDKCKEIDELAGAIASGDTVPKYLKYKLSEIVATTNYFDAIDRYYCSDIKSNLTDNNTKYKDVNNNTVDNHLDSMPREFRNRLKSDNSADVPGIYRWTLVNAVHDFDIDDYSPINTAINVQRTIQTAFDSIFTTSVSPGTGSSIMWFNGIEYDELNGNYIFLGWSNTREFLSFVKFVPVYVNDFAISEDSALNLNYNVNITGDHNNSKRNITVHGDVNCDNINVYKLTATGEIKNIYTKDDIIGESGIKLSKIDDGTNNDSFAFTVVGGNVNCDNINTKNSINSDSLEVNKFINTNNINTKSVNIGGDSNAHANIIVNENENTNENAVVADLSSVDKINISGINKTINTVTDVPIIVSNMPTHMINDSNIVISNQASDSNEVYFKNTIRDVLTENGLIETGKGVDTKNTSFDSAKNFNMHRLSLNSKSSIGKDEKHTAVGEIVVDEYEGKALPGTNKNVSDDYTEFTSEAISSRNIDAFCIQKMTMTKLNTDDILNTSNDINIVFDDTFLFHVYLEGRSTNGGWPALHNSSKMTIELYYSTGNNTLTSTGIQKDYSFVNSTDNIKNDNGYEWKGYDEEGKNLTNNTNWHKRYHSYRFRPYDMTISKSSGIFNTIKENYDDGKEVSIYAVVSFYIKGIVCKNEWGNRKYLLRSAGATCPRPHSGTSLMPVTRINTYGAGVPIAFYAKDCTGKAEYYINPVLTESNGVNSTVICDDGIVMRAGGYVFGLGYTKAAVNHNVVGYNRDNNAHWIVNSNTDSNYIENIPILFYHKYDDAMYDANHEPSGVNNNKSSEGYAKRTNAIPLETLFTIVEQIQSSNTGKYGI